MLLATLGVSLRRVKKSKIPGQRVMKAYEKTIRVVQKFEYHLIN